MTENAHNPATDSAATQPIDLQAGRRAFMRSVGLGTAAMALGGAAIGLPTAAEAQPAQLDVEILNFALNLEYLEAEFYLMAVSGKGLGSNDIFGTGNVGAVRGGAQVPFADPLVKAYALEIANDERNHVRFLRSALGTRAVARPALDIGTAFTVAAQAAGLIGAGETFNAYADDASFLLAAYIFEDVGVTAYHGAAPLLENKDYLLAAAGILAVEAYHAGLIRTVLFSQQKYAATAKISALRATLDGTINSATGAYDQGVGLYQAEAGAKASNIVPTDGNGLAFARSPGQVLNIVYGAAGAKRGLFFPQGARTTFNAAQSS